MPWSRRPIVTDTLQSNETDQVSIIGFYFLRLIVTDTLQSVEFPDKVNLGCVQNIERKMTTDAIGLSNSISRQRLVVPCVAAN